MKTPQFWSKKFHIIPLLLLPLSLIYVSFYYWRFFVITKFFAKKRLKIKTICIGNITTGGAGKTPIAIAIGKILQQKKIKFCYLSRGYGGSNTDKLSQVNHKINLSSEFGDEPLLLSEIGDCFVFKNRKKALQMINDKNIYDVVILDDGLQNPWLQKNLSILVIDGEYIFGNGFIFPAGPMREFLFTAIKKVQLVIAVGGDVRKINNLKVNYDWIKIIAAEVNSIFDDNLKDLDILAFSGIARPEKFFNGLKKHGFKVKKTLSFADHYQYSEKDLQNIINIAKQQQLKILTTKKDWVRLNEQYRKIIDYIDINIDIKGKNFYKTLDKFLGS